MFAGHHKLDGLTAIIDYNKIQGMGAVKDILALEPLVTKWESFSWAVKEINGHNLGQVLDTLKNVPMLGCKPTCIIAHTIKGKGVSFMEGETVWHYRSPNLTEFYEALNELNARA